MPREKLDKLLPLAAYALGSVAFLVELYKLGSTLFLVGTLYAAYVVLREKG